LPHATDAFPHLDDFLPRRSEGPPVRRSQRRRPIQTQENEEQ
jgi:hypothetical protein